MGGPRTSSEAALSGPGRRASQGRDAHTRHAGSLAGTVGTTLPGKDRPSASMSARHSPVPDQLRGLWRPAAEPLGLLRCRSHPEWFVLSRLPRPNRGPSSLRSSRFKEQWPPAAWTTAAATPCGPQRGLQGERLSAALRFCTKGEGMSPRQKRKKQSLGLETETQHAPEPSRLGTTGDC